MALAASFMTSGALGVSTSIAIMLHEIPHEVACSPGFLYLPSHFETPRVLIASFFLAAPFLGQFWAWCGYTCLPNEEAQLTTCGVPSMTFIRPVSRLQAFSQNLGGFSRLQFRLQQKKSHPSTSNSPQPPMGPFFALVLIWSPTPLRGGEPSLNAEPDLFLPPCRRFAAGRGLRPPGPGGDVAASLPPA